MPRDQKLIRNKNKEHLIIYFSIAGKWNRNQYMTWCPKSLGKFSMEYVPDGIGVVSSLQKLSMWHILLLCLRAKISDYHIVEYETLAHPNVMQKCIYHFNITSKHPRNLWYSSLTIMKTCRLVMKHVSSYRTHIVLLDNDC